MDFCTSHFGKSLADMSISDIESYFLNERIETDQLEFKSINPNGNIEEKFSGIQRSISGFLNSSGGLIIWGAPQGQKISGRKEKIYKGGLTFFNQIFEKDFIISKISDSIIPMPNNIRVKTLDDGNKCLIVLEIDISEYSPHQFSNTYYMRIDGQTRPAPHHYIEALFKKIKYPNIEAFLSIKDMKIQGGNVIIKILVAFFNWSALQNEEQLAFRIFTNGIFHGSSFQVNFNRYSNEGHEFFKTNAKDVVYYGEPIYEVETIIFDLGDFLENNSKAKIDISFGGKFSPRKNCQYEINLRGSGMEDYDAAVTIINENILSIDLIEQKGQTKESIIKSLKNVKLKQ